MRTYPEALHAMQTGVKLELEKVGDEKSGCSPKQLRVGLNSVAVGQSALVQLLIAKGVFTLDEYMAALTVAANEEAERYEAILAAIFGRPVKLY